MTSSPAVSPATFVMSITETLLLDFDMTAYLTGGNIVSSFSASFQSTYYGTSTDFQAMPGLTGNVIQQEVSGPNDLKTTGIYLMIVNMVDSAGQTWAAELVITAID